MEGKNFVQLSGFMRYPDLRLTSNGFHLFKGKLEVPIEYKKNDVTVKSSLWVPLIGWGDKANALGELIDGTPVEVHGSLSLKGYEKACKNCGGSSKATWTEVKVDSFRILLDE